MCGSPAAALVPGWDRSFEFGDAGNCYAFLVEDVYPFGSSEMPFGEGYGFAFDDEVFRVAGVFSADFRVVAFEDDPHWVDLVGLVGEFEPDYDSMVGKGLLVEIDVDPGVEEIERIGVLGCDFKSSFTPFAHGVDDRRQVLSLLSQLIDGSGAVFVRCLLDDVYGLEVS